MNWSDKLTHLLKDLAIVQRRSTYVLAPSLYILYIYYLYPHCSNILNAMAIYIEMSVCLSVCLSVSPSVCVSVRPSVCMSVYLSIYKLNNNFCDFFNKYIYISPFYSSSSVSVYINYLYYIIVLHYSVCLHIYRSIFLTI